MAADNSGQIAEWNGALGDRWARDQARMDEMTEPFGNDALAAANARPGEQAADIGCGCGDTSLALAQSVGPHGAVIGVDVSEAMLGVARKRADAAGLKNLRFEQADASIGGLPQGSDLLFSRFGVMFFAAPALAFAHMRKSLKAGGRIAFVCWQAARNNPWALVPVTAARQALGLQNAPPPDPNAPGPFAFADADRVRSILQDAGFRDIGIAPHEHQIRFGRSVEAAAQDAVQMGPVARLVREAGPDHLPKVTEAVAKALEPLARNGEVALPGRTWVVTARSG